MTPMTVEFDIHIERTERGARRGVAAGPAPEPAPARVPRIAKFMALAIRRDRPLAEEAVKDQAALARLGRVTPARMSQIMSLRNLAPDIQESLLFLPRVEQGRDPLVLRDVLSLAAEVD